MKEVSLEYLQEELDKVFEQFDELTDTVSAEDYLRPDGAEENFMLGLQFGTLVGRIQTLGLFAENRTENTIASLRVRLHEAMNEN